MEKKISGLSRKERRRIRRSNYASFLELFNFFLKSYRNGIIDFSGSYPIKVRFDKSAKDAKFCFTAYNNGEYSNKNLEKGIKTKHPNILRAVIEGKKGWGLWNQTWAEGVAENLFKEEEILKEFENHNIKIPDNLLQDFRNTVLKKRKILFYNKFK